MARARRTIGPWTLLDCRPAWDGNSSVADFLAYLWDGPDGDRLLIAVNYAPYRRPVLTFASPSPTLPAATGPSTDLLNPTVYDRDGDDLSSSGLYLSLPPWGYHAFRLTPS